jgi:hypothetical protein
MGGQSPQEGDTEVNLSLQGPPESWVPCLLLPGLSHVPGHLQGQGGEPAHPDNSEASSGWTRRFGDFSLRIFKVLQEYGVLFGGL